MQSDAEWYQSYHVRNWQTLYASRMPAAFALPATGRQLSAVITCANRLGLPWTARDGGHNYEATSLVNGGVVIDLSK